MSGLFHSFFLLSRNEYPYRGFEGLYHSPEALQIHDDHLRYLYDSLQWIPCVNPGNKLVDHTGLNLYGQTIIKTRGAVVAKAIFRAWADLFLCGPDTLELTGSYTFGPDEREGSYEKLKVDRDSLVDVLEKLIVYCDQVVASKDEKFILHLGI